MRLRIPEMLAERGWSAYRLAQELARHDIGTQTAYRLARGTASRFDAATLEALAAVFGIPDSALGDLFTRKPLRPRKPHRPGRKPTVTSS